LLEPAASKEHRTVSRVAAILEAAAESAAGVRLASIADDLDAPKSSVHGLLKGLVAVGYLAEREGHYTLGPGIQELFAPSKQPSLAEIAREPMSWLRDEFDETVMLGVRVGDSIVYLHALESEQLIRYSPPLHKRRPLFPTSMGKVYLADLPRPRVEKYLETRVTDRTRRLAFLDEIDEIHHRGVAFNHSETVPGVFGAASAVRQVGRLIACLGLAGPHERLGAREDAVEKSVRAAARRLTESLP
jgi:DNA-binding IclR family transcriptional regulator